MKTRLLLSVGLLATLFAGPACKTLETGDKTARDRYQEDLSQVRKEFEAAKKADLSEPEEEINEMEVTVGVSGDVNKRLEVVYDTLKERRGKNPAVQGFTVQVYAGPSRSEANEAKEKVYHTLENVNPELQYIQPNFKVKVGQFLDRLEAQKMYAQLREEFPQALIIPEKIYLK
ncbi:SPOR domain-containing protein [Roseivirga sp. BDSF3-8]|uniref:SPOR domain-containing protein n=1 Tax=Roseivirga sp. BDSF3-8 TaxID=3241598 RepID=UPI0035318F01